MKTALAALVFAGALCAATQVFELDPSKTEIGFVVHSTLHTVHGKFQLKRGSLRLDSDTGQASGEIVIDVASGDSGSQSRDKRMQKEVLESQKYPEAIFTPDRFTGHLAAQGKSQIDVHGRFKIHGADHEMTLRFDVEADNGQYTAASQFEIPYIQWGMKNPSNFLLKVDDKAQMEVRAVAKAKP